MRLFRGQILLFHLLALAAVCPFVAHGQEYSRIRSTQTGKAFRTLTHAKIFNLGGVGFANGMTAEEKAFRVLLKSGDSVASFQRLVREANPEGKLFGLYGLYLEAPEAFKSEAERLKYDDDSPERWDEMIFIEKVRYGPRSDVSYFVKTSTYSLTKWRRESLTRPSRR